MVTLLIYGVIFLALTFISISATSQIRSTVNLADIEAKIAYADTSAVIASVHRADSIANRLATYTDSVATALATLTATNLNTKVNKADSLTKYTTPKQIGDSAFLKRVALTGALITGTLGYTPLQPSDTNSLSNRINNKISLSSLSASNGVSYNNSTGAITGNYSQGSGITISSATISAVGDSVQYFNSGGRIRKILKHWTDTLSVSSSSGQVVDISSAGFTGIYDVQACAFRNTGTSTSVPNVSIKSYTTTSVTLNIIEGNGSLINILGSNVLLGPSTAFASTSGLKILVHVTGF